jgi:rod shape-determining protein MreC
MSLDNRGIGRKGGISRRGSVLFLLILAILLIYITNSGPRLLTSIRQFTYDLIAPVTEFIGRPVVALRKTGNALTDYTDLINENAKLKAQLNDLLAWEDRALRLEAKIVRYERLLNVKIDGQYNFKTSRVVADLGGPFVRTVLINSGEDENIRVGQAVFGASGFIGQVVSVGNSSSRVLLLTDLNSRIPVQLEPSGLQAILTGDNTNEPILNFYDDKDVPEKGARVVTSGYGGRIAPGLIIGTVDVNREGQPRVKLREKITNMNYVRVLDFKFIEAPEDETQLPEALKITPKNSESQNTDNKIEAP